VTRLNTEMNKILAQKDMLDYFDTSARRRIRPRLMALRLCGRGHQALAEIVEIGQSRRRPTSRSAPRAVSLEVESALAAGSVHLSHRESRIA